jgi:hypothetical protein
MAKTPGSSFTRRAPDNITEELVAILSSKTAYEFKPLFDIILTSLRERNAASGGEEMLRLRCYEKLQSLVSQGVVDRKVNGTVKTNTINPMRTTNCNHDTNHRSKCTPADLEVEDFPPAPSRGRPKKGGTGSNAPDGRRWESKRFPNQQKMWTLI